MSVERLDNAAIGQAVCKEDRFAPRRVGLSGIDDETITYGKDRIAEIAILAADSVEIVSSMKALEVFGLSLGPKATRIVSE